jgi:outer membrane lipoprotein-sorting protein
MRLRNRLAFAVAIALALLPARAAHAADDLAQVLSRLDAAAANFHSSSAEFEFDSVTTDPIYDKEIQKGTVYYERKGNAFQMSVHIREENSKPVPKVMIVSGGIFKLYEAKTNQVTTSNKASKYESYLMLGFGASGKDLEKKWDIKYIGTETLDGIKTDKLELVAKDPQVLKLFPKVTIWMDTERGVSLKQVFDEGPGQYRVCVYFNFKTNQPLPADAFTFKTEPNPTFVNR